MFVAGMMEEKLRGKTWKRMLEMAKVIINVYSELKCHTIPSPLHILSHLIFTAIQQSRYCYQCYSNREAKWDTESLMVCPELSS